jgi:hypothetical protein
MKAENHSNSECQTPQGRMYSRDAQHDPSYRPLTTVDGEVRTAIRPDSQCNGVYPKECCWRMRSNARRVVVTRVEGANDEYT